MSVLNPDELMAHTRAERERIADLLDGLSGQQWESMSLCAGWRVREVVAHMTMPFRTRQSTVLAGMIAAGFSFNRYADRDAKRTAAALEPWELAELQRANITHPWSPPGGGPAGALSHDVIHGLDITEAIGLPPPSPDRIAVVLHSSTDRQIRYFGVDLRGHQMVANDADATIGQGSTRLELPAKDILLVVTGRRSLQDMTR